MMMMILMTTWGCALECNLMYAPDFTEITLTASEAFPTDQDLSVLFSGSDGQLITCNTAADSGSVLCDSEGAFVTVEDGSLIASLQAFSPDTVDATLWLGDNDDPIGQWSGEPDYNTDEPNGRGCGERTIGTLSMDIGDVLSSDP